MDPLWDSWYGTADAVQGYAGDVFLDAGDAAAEDARRQEPRPFGFSPMAQAEPDRIVVER